MKPNLVRFGVAIDAPLLGELDVLVAERGCTRSELFRDLARAEIGRAKVPRGVDAVGALTLVYDHHVRDLPEKLTELQHELGEEVRASLHVHLSHDLCLEVIVVRGKSDQLQEFANHILAMRGVKHGGIEIVADAWGREQLGAVSAGGTARSSASAPARGGRRARPAKTGKSEPPPAPPRRGHSHGGRRHEH